MEASRRVSPMTSMARIRPARILSRKTASRRPAGAITMPGAPSGGTVKSPASAQTITSQECEYMRAMDLWGNAVSPSRPRPGRRVGVDVVLPRGRLLYAPNRGHSFVLYQSHDHHPNQLKATMPKQQNHGTPRCPQAGLRDGGRQETGSAWSGACAEQPVRPHFSDLRTLPRATVGPRSRRTIDPANEAHDMITGVFGGLSKGERNRIRIRVLPKVDQWLITELGPTRRAQTPSKSAAESTPPSKSEHGQKVN